MNEVLYDSDGITIYVSHDVLVDGEPTLAVAWTEDAREEDRIAALDLAMFGGIAW